MNRRRQRAVAADFEREVGRPPGRATVTERSLIGGRVVSRYQPSEWRRAKKAHQVGRRRGPGRLARTRALVENAFAVERRREARRRARNKARAAVARVEAA